MIAGAGGIAWALRRPAPDTFAARLAWVATGRQLGPVGYRDPVGAISPDGKWIAYSEGRFLRVRSVDGGPAIDLPPGEAQIRNLSWNPDSRSILADGSQTQGGWAIYDVIARTRRGFVARDVARPFQGRDQPDREAESLALHNAVWSPDGKTIAGIVNGTEGQELRIVNADGTVAQSERAAGRIAFPAWTPRGEVACIP